MSQNGTSGMDGSTAGKPSARRRLRVWLIPFFFWSLPALLTTKYVMEDKGLTFVEAFLAEGLIWMVWAVATPGILVLVRRLPIERPHLIRNVAIHVMVGISMGVSMGGLAQVLRRLVLTQEQLAAFGEVSAASLVAWGLLFGLIFYAAVACVGFALDYHRRLRERELAASRLEAQLIEAKLNALRVQLQPHFLFNALNSVSMLVRQGDSSTAVRMVARLSDLLRYVLDGGSESLVPLGAEVDFVSRYLEIEQLRFRDRMCVSIEVDDAIQDAAVPGLLLQPLVENAVRHAVAVRAAPTRITLDVGETNGRLEIRLRDDGPGLPDSFDEADCDGIGLSNTRSRLAFTYGTEAGLAIGPAPGGGTEVRLNLPFRRHGSIDA
jgi:two-component system LytT family sensor kinase